MRAEVESQIKVRDFSRASVSIQPAEHASWSECRNDMMVEAKRPLKAAMTSELAAAASDAESTKIREAFALKERALEQSIDYMPLEVSCTRFQRLIRDAHSHSHSHIHSHAHSQMHMEIQCAYNFLSH